MESLIHADVFFFVTTIAVVLVGAALTAVLIYLVFILRDIKTILRSARDEAQEFIADARRFRERIKEQGASLGQLLSFFRMEKPHTKRSKQKSTARE